MFQSLFVLDRKLMYVFSGGEDVPDFLECGELTSLVRPWCDVDDGGVRGCDEDPETFRESNFSISACEYEAPTTRFGSRPDFFGVFSRWTLQKGEADSDRSTWTISCWGGFLPLPEEENMVTGSVLQLHGCTVISAGRSRVELSDPGRWARGMRK